MILRFATHPDLDIFTNNEAERTIRPVKVQQRSSGGCWRTLQGLADFAVAQSYLSTVGKMGPQQTRRPPRPLQRPRLDTTRPRTRRITPLTTPCHIRPLTLAE
jgi:hypothetical protein